MPEQEESLEAIMLAMDVPWPIKSSGLPSSDQSVMDLTLRKNKECFGVIPVSKIATDTLWPSHPSFGVLITVRFMSFFPNGFCNRFIVGTTSKGTRAVEEFFPLYRISGATFKRPPVPFKHSCSVSTW